MTHHIHTRSQVLFNIHTQYT